MLKPILLAGAMLVAAPVLAQVNANTGASAKPGSAAAKVKAKANQATTTTHERGRSRANPGMTDTMGGTPGTTHSHDISTSTDGIPDTESPTVDAKTDPAAKSVPPEAHAGAVSVTGTAGTGTGAAGAPTVVSGGGFTGVGGPGGDLIDVAGEMLGDASRVEQVMRGRDPSMKASDLLNQAVLTLMQSSAASPR